MLFDRKKKLSNQNDQTVPKRIKNEWPVFLTAGVQREDIFGGLRLGELSSPGFGSGSR